MKGVIFTEFLDFVEAQTSYEVVDEILELADTPSGGVYTATGKYHYEELASLLTQLSLITDQPVPKLLRAFGKHLLGRFYDFYPQFFVTENDSLSLLEKVENHVHVEVKKLYPDAELPTLDVQRQGPNDVVVTYISCRPLGDLCVGLIEGCAAHFGEIVDLSVVRIDHGLQIAVSRKGSE